MDYESFRDKILEAIHSFPKGHIFCLREIFGTEIWNTLEVEKLNFGSRFFKEYNDGNFPMIKEKGKSHQGEQLYEKIK